MAQLTPEQQKAIAIATARLRLQQQGTPVPPALQGTRDAQAAKYPSSQEQGRGGSGVDAEPGILQQAMRHAQDFTTGIDKAGGSFIQSGGDWVANTLGMKVPPPRMTPTGRDVFAPDNTAQSVGNVVGKAGLAVGSGMGAGPILGRSMIAGGLTGALQNPDSPEIPAALGMAAPMVSPAIGAIKKALPSRDRAGKAFDVIKEKLKTTPVDTTKAQEVLNRANQLGRVGNTRPKVISDFDRRVMGPKGQGNPPLTYPESFDFASKAKALSQAEIDAIKKTPMEAQVNRLAEALQTANRDVAAKAGMGKAFDAAMKEYRRASTIAQKTAIVKKYAKIAAITAVATGAAGTAIKKVFLD